jgi:hypothetical protein
VAIRHSQPGQVLHSAIPCGASHSFLPTSSPSSTSARRPVLASVKRGIARHPANVLRASCPQIRLSGLRNFELPSAHGQHPAADGKLRRIPESHGWHEVCLGLRRDCGHSHLARPYFAGARRGDAGTPFVQRFAEGPAARAFADIVRPILLNLQNQTTTIGHKSTA